MTATLTAEAEHSNGSPLLEVEHISKYFGNVIALQDISVFVRAGEVTCLLGDNGAGKSTLIKTLSGVHKADEGVYRFEGEEVEFSSPRDALEKGIATVYQDLAMIPLMSIWRNFFLGSEPTRGLGPVPSLRHRFRQADHPRGDVEDGDRHPRSRPAGGHALRW